MPIVSPRGGSAAASDAAALGGAADVSSTASVVAASAPSPDAPPAAAAWPAGGPLGAPRAYVGDTLEGLADAEGPATSAAAPSDQGDAWTPGGLGARNGAAGSGSGLGLGLGLGFAAAPADADPGDAADGGSGGPLAWARVGPSNRSAGPGRPTLWGAPFTGCGAPCLGAAERTVLCRDARALPLPPSACEESLIGAWWPLHTASLHV